MPNWKDLKARKSAQDIVDRERKRLRDKHINRIAIDYADKAEQKLYKECSKQSPGQICGYAVRDLLGFSKFKLELAYDVDEINTLYDNIGKELETRLNNQGVSVQKYKFILIVCLP